MAKAQLDPKICPDVACPAGKRRIDVFDVDLSGFLLEVRESGGKTSMSVIATPAAW